VLLLLQLLLLPQTIQAQSVVAELSGEIRDTIGQPIEAVTVLLMRDATVLATTASNANGRFAFQNVQTGSYVLSFNCLGFQSTQLAITAAPNMESIAVTLQANSQELEDVQIVSERTQGLPSGTLVFQAQGTALANGRSTLELMRYVKGLTVTPSAVLVNGRSGTRIFLDASRRTISLAELQSIPAPEILKVEVEPQAGAEFGAASGGGTSYGAIGAPSRASLAAFRLIFR